MQLLDRVNIESYEGELASERRKLLDSAVTKLGYKPANPATLIHKLLAIGIAPYKQEQVSAYKQSKVKAGMWSGTKFYIGWSISTILCFVTSYKLWFELNFKGFLNNQGNPTHVIGYFMIIASFLLGGAGIIGLMGVFINASKVGHGHRTKHFWAQCEIPSYVGTIPDYILNTALRVKEAIPTASFGIDYLATGDDWNLVPAPPDPFLYVWLNNEKYYVEQWDEKDLDRVDA